MKEQVAGYNNELHMATMCCLMFGGTFDNFGSSRALTIWPLTFGGPDTTEKTVILGITCLK